MRWLFIICGLFTGYFQLNAQNNPFTFSNLNEENGLSNNVVNCFLKDHRGILWVGTYNGFCRFDGSNFYTYKIRKGDNSPANEVVHSLCEDHAGNLWAATDNGVFCYLPAEDRYINYPIKSLGKGPNFTNVVCDTKGNVWAAGRWSVFRLNPGQKTFEEIIKPVEPTGDIYKFAIKKNGLLEDPSGNGLWMATSFGVMFYDVAGKQVINYSNSRDSLFRFRNTGALSRSASGGCWFFDNDQKEIVLFDPHTYKTLHHINIASTMPNAIGATLFEDKSRRLWFSSWTYEMLVADLTSNDKISLLTNVPGDNRSIAGQFFWAALQDDNNTIWLGTVAGISRCNPERAVYKEYRMYETIPELKNTWIVFADEDPADKTLWLVTGNALLIHYDPYSKRYESFDIAKALPGNGGSRPGNMNRLLFYRDHIILNTSTGTWQIRKGERQMKPFNLLPKGYEYFVCKEIVFDKDSVIYYNNGSQLLYWNRITDKTNLLQFAPKPGNNWPAFSEMLLGRDKKLWFVSFNAGIGYAWHGQLRSFNITGNTDVSNGVMLSMDQDTGGKIWVLNKGVGIYRFDPQTTETKMWNETDGLAANSMHKLIIDDTGRVWSMLFNNVSVYTPGTDRFFNFKIPYGESNIGYINYLSRKADGSILGTIKNEIVEFSPGKLFAVPVPEKPTISRFNVSGKDFNLFSTVNPILQPDENTVRFRFGTTISKNIFPNDIEYMLGGAETTWTTAGENQEAVYNNLPPGNYTFRIRVKGKNSSWQSPETVFSLSVKAPFYKTSWFLVIAVLFMVLVVSLVYRFRLRQKEKLMLLETKAQALEKEKAMVMYENLKQHLNPHFLFNSLTSLSSLIRLDQNQAGDFLDKMSKVYRYILKNRDKEVVPISDEMKFVQLYIDLQKTRFEDGLLVSMNIDEEYHQCKIAPVTLQNLVENAIKHNTADTESPLVIELFIENDYLVIRNNLQKKKFVETSNRQGLANMESLYRYLSSRPMEIIENDHYFIVKIPLI